VIGGVLPSALESASYWEIAMPKRHTIRLSGIVSCVMVGLWAAVAPAQETPLYINCEHGFAVIFPREPQTREIAYTTHSGAIVLARQFYVERGTDRFAVTVADFSKGPAVDDQHVEHAAVALRQKGEVRFQAAAPYDPGMPGRQLNVFEPNNRQTRASVYMADHRLYITEASSEVGNFNALQFEQSNTLIDKGGVDRDRNANQEPRRFSCA
jgi:hypothetical protein